MGRGLYSMKTIIVTKREMDKARKASKTIIPASDRPWSRPTVYKSGKEYRRNPKHKGYNYE